MTILRPIFLQGLRIGDDYIINVETACGVFFPTYRGWANKWIIWPKSKLMVSPFF